jgi:ATP-dependent helicase/nuclease subunit A
MTKTLTPYQKSALDYSSNILLSANAGSGKTFVLSKRFVEILVNEEIEIDNIVAITFTDKAAGELNKKIAEEIELRIKSETDNNKLRKLEHIRRQLVSANISTIHSFCINILKEFAPEAGIDANFTPIDQSASDELISLAIHDSLNQLIVNNEFEFSVKYLIRFFASKNLLVKKIHDAVNHRKIIEQHLIGIYNKSEPDFVNYLNKMFEYYFNRLFSSKIEYLIKDITSINQFILKKKQTNEIAHKVIPLLSQLDKAVTIIRKIEILSEIAPLILTQKEELKNRDYLAWERESFFNEINRIEIFFRNINPILKSDFSPDCLKEYYSFGQHFIRVFNYVLNSYTNKKIEKGYIDFEDILLLTQNIIQVDDVKEFLRIRFKYIMIDEYQDTNELQYKIFMPILDQLKEGNLFVVGDEKQSIYMFRDAELEVFNKTKYDIEKLDDKGKLLLLPHSFRMKKQLVLFTNKLFKELFNKPEPVLNEVDYSELICVRDESETGYAEFLLVDENEGIKEADLVASKITGLVASDDVVFGDIAILCRKRSMFTELESALVKYKIPFNVIGGKGFYQKQSVSDVYNYLSFLINNFDDAALIGVLRSPFYNVSDTRLFEISLEEGSNFYSKLKSFAEKNEDIRKIIDSLNEHQQLLLSADVSALIRKILSDRAYWAVISSKKNSDQEIANLKKLLAIAREYSKKGFKNLYDFTVYLRDAIESVEDEGQAQISKVTNTVKLLTIHQAKGLEFKAVFLYGCNEAARDSSIKSRSMGIDKEFGFPVKVFLNGNYFSNPVASHIVAMVNYIHHQKNIAEIKRLLYVAVTRAMNCLFISAAHKNYNASRDSFFSFLQTGLKKDFNCESIVISDEVEFMTQKEDRFSFDKKTVETEIKIIKKIDAVNIPEIDDENKSVEKVYLLQKIEERPSKEIISATKVSMFAQCPVKYELTYELGFPTIFNVIKRYSNNHYNFNSKEDEELRFFADVKGRIIHEALKENPENEEIENLINNLMQMETINEPDAAVQLKIKIIKELNEFCKSDFYQSIKKQKKFYNEYEIYAEEGDNYLYGIIDKFIIELDRLVIIDYKTDDIELIAVNKRAEDYFQQLTFYAFVLSRYYKSYDKYELIIAYTKYPDKVVSKNLLLNDLIKYKEQLSALTNKMQDRIFKPNYDHCSSCHFTLEGNKCIKPQ